MHRAALLALLMVLVPLTGTGTATTPATLLEAPEPTSAGQALVGFRPSHWPDLAAGDDLRGLTVLAVIPQVHVAVVAANDLRDVRAALAGLPGLAYVEDDVLLTTTATPNDALYADQYGPTMMGFPTAWGSAGYGVTTEVTVAVLDTGIRRTHEDLDAGRILPGYDYVNDDRDPSDDCGHGTHVAGTVGATTDNGLGVAGMAQPTLLPMKVLGPVGHALTSGFLTCTGTSSDISQAIIDSTFLGADVISMSLGGEASTAMKNVADWAYARGVLLVAAAGNDGAGNDVDCPACYSSVIAVAALDENGDHASYSDTGPEVEIAAPGDNVWSTDNADDADYDSRSGTSMATPHVAGALALALACKPSLGATSLRSLMQANAQDKGATGRDDLYGFGLLRVDDLLADVGTCSNNAPSASFTASTSGTTLSVDAGASSDADGHDLRYFWTFGDGTVAQGETARHTYVGGGSYTVQLTVDDGNDGTATTSTSVGVTGSRACGTDPEPLLHEVGGGNTQHLSLRAGEWAYRKVCVPSSASVLASLQDATGCTDPVVLCPDADLYVRAGARPDENNYDCRPFQRGSDEECTLPSTAQWLVVGIHAAGGNPAVTLTVTGASGQPDNSGPTAVATASVSGPRVTLDAGASHDPEGDPLTYSWTFGDGGTGTGALASHTYASTGTYTATLTVSDGRGATGTTSTQVTIASSPCGGGPGATTHVLTSRTAYAIAMDEGDWHHRAVCVAAGDSLDVVLDGEDCLAIPLCNPDADLYVRAGSPPTTTTYDCRPFLAGSDESCTFAPTVAGWYYVSVNASSGSGTVHLSAIRT